MMKRIAGLCVLAAILGPSVTLAQDGSLLQTDDQRTLYAIGSNFGNQVVQQLGSLGLSAGELKFVVMGLKDAVLGRKPQVDLSVFGSKIPALAQARQATNQAHQAANAGKEKAKSKAYIAKASKEKGAVVTASGLVFIPITAGTGDSPKATDHVKVHYHGMLTNGQVFDSSVQRGQPAEFPLNGVIPCWTEGVQKMKVGGKAKLVCPSSIAYGDQGHPPQIPGGATLVFEVELLDIVKKPQAAESGAPSP